MHMDYNFVVFGYDSGFYRTVLSDIMGLNSVIYRDLWGTKNKIAAMIYKLYFTPRLPNGIFLSRTYYTMPPAIFISPTTAPFAFYPSEEIFTTEPILSCPT